MIQGLPWKASGYFDDGLWFMLQGGHYLGMNYWKLSGRQRSWRNPDTVLFRNLTGVAEENENHRSD
jgi:hypothetical protein